MTLYLACNEDFQSKEHPEKCGDAYVGCLRIDCALSGADRCDFWSPPGNVYRTLSPIEMILADEGTNDQGVVIINDLQDSREAIPISN